MTLEHCAGNCTGYAYFGVEYMQECYCSNTLTFGSYIATDGRCDMLCGVRDISFLFFSPWDLILISMLCRATLARSAVVRMV